MATLESQLDTAVRAACPMLAGVCIGNPADRATWGLTFVSGATDAQIAVAEAALAAFVPAPILPLITARAFIETMFTMAEQQALYTAAQTPAGWQVSKFISLITASPTIDLANSELIADIQTVATMGLLTQARATQILAGTPAPTS